MNKCNPSAASSPGAEAAIGDQALSSGMRIAEDQDGVVLGALVITEIPAA
jgi:hypothetical protein